jgi:hypothetical protein
MLHTIFSVPVYFKKTLTLCCDFPKWSTCPLYLFCLLYSNSHIVTTSNLPSLRHPAQQNSQANTFIVPTGKYSFPHASALLIHWNTATLRCLPLSEANSIIGPWIRIQISTSTLIHGNAATCPDIHWLNADETLAPQPVLPSTMHIKSILQMLYKKKFAVCSGDPYNVITI